MGRVRAKPDAALAPFGVGASARPLARHETAQQCLGPGQAVPLRLVFSAFAIAILLAPQLAFAALHVVLLAGFATLILWRLLLALVGATLGWRDTPILPATPLSLPRYTVLVALYKENKALPGLVSSLSGLDYPASRLEVFFLVEADDSDTRDALNAMPLPAHFRVITVPDGQPRTKPRAEPWTGARHGIEARDL